MRVLVACEFSGIVRDAFTRRGHSAMSCDLIPSELEGLHYQGDVFDVIYAGEHFWDLMIAFPPCTHLAVSGARWFKGKEQEQEQALLFVQRLMNAPIPRIAIENPISVISSRIRKPDQIIQPWQFGHGEVKATCTSTSAADAAPGVSLLPRWSKARRSCCASFTEAAARNALLCWQPSLSERI